MLALRELQRCVQNAILSSLRCLLALCSLDPLCAHLYLRVTQISASTAVHSYSKWQLKQCTQGSQLQMYVCMCWSLALLSLSSLALIGATHWERKLYFYCAALRSFDIAAAEPSMASACAFRSCFLLHCAKSNSLHIFSRCTTLVKCYKASWMPLFAGLLVKTKALASIQRPKARFSYV